MNERSRPGPPGGFPPTMPMHRGVGSTDPFRRLGGWRSLPAGAGDTNHCLGRGIAAIFIHPPAHPGAVRRAARADDADSAGDRRVLFCSTGRSPTASGRAAGAGLRWERS